MALRIGFVDTKYYQSRSVNSWSGLPYYMSRCLQEADFEVVPIESSADYNRGWPLLRFGWEKILRRRRYLRDRSPIYLRKLAKEVELGAKRNRVDVIFAPSSLPISYLAGDTPAVFWTDAAFSGMLGFYDSFSHLTPTSVHDGENADYLSLNRACIAFYASDWAAEFAVKTNTRAAHKVHVVRFGGNVDDAENEATISQAVSRRGTKVFRLLFIGVDWTRKGGAFALEVARLWRTRGAKVELHIVGCEPPTLTAADEPWIVRHGFVSKQTLAGRATLKELMISSDWLILPSQSECFGLVFAEAAAHGLPSLSTNVGGIPCAIEQGKSGFLFPLNAPASTWVETLERFARDRASYAKLCERSRAWYDYSVNWRTAGDVVGKRIRKVLAEQGKTMSMSL